MRVEGIYTHLATADGEWAADDGAGGAGCDGAGVGTSRGVRS